MFGCKRRLTNARSSSTGTIRTIQAVSDAREKYCQNVHYVPNVDTPIFFRHVSEKKANNSIIYTSPSFQVYYTYQKKRWDGEPSHRVPTGHCAVSDREVPNQHADDSGGSKRCLSMQAMITRAWIRKGWKLEAATTFIELSDSSKREARNFSVSRKKTKQNFQRASYDTVHTLDRLWSRPSTDRS